MKAFPTSRGRQRTRRRIAAVVCGVVALGGIGLGLRQASDLLYAGPMLQNVATNGFSVAWWRAGGGQDELWIRTAASDPPTVYPAARHGAHFEARASELKSGTAYAYEIRRRTRGASRLLCAGQARTAPPPGTPFSFLVFADSGSGQAAQYELAQIMDRQSADLVLHAGDLIYGSVGPGNYARKFFRPYRNLLRRAFFYPVLGNHDLKSSAGQTFLEKFSLPADGPTALPPKHCYWFDYGDARFVGIDSNLDSNTLAGVVAPWLQDVLGAATCRWKFVYFHHAPWAGGTRPANAAICATLVPAIEAGDADIVFCGHNHLFERTPPLRAGRIAPTHGTVYVTTGAGGKSLQAERHGGAEGLAAYDDAQFSFTRVRVDAGHVVIEQIGAENDVLDRVVLDRQAPTA